MEAKGLILTFSFLLASICLLLAGTGLHNNILIGLGVFGCVAWIAFTIWFVNSKYGNF